MSEHIRKAKPDDASRIAEIEIFNYRLNFYPIFKDDGYYFGELNVRDMIKEYESNCELIGQTFIYDDGAVKGFIRVDSSEIKKLFVEPVLQSMHIGEKLLAFAVDSLGADMLYALEENRRAISFYERHGFVSTKEKLPVDETDRYLIKMILKK